MGNSVEFSKETENKLKSFIWREICMDARDASKIFRKTKTLLVKYIPKTCELFFLISGNN